MAMSDGFIHYWWLIFGILFGGGYMFIQTWKRSEKMQFFMDRLLLKMPIFGDLVLKSVVARWTRTLSTMFAAGVPLVEALDSVGGTSGNLVFAQATQQIQRDVAAGSALTTAMTSANVFPTMVLQMSAIGEESGALDDMLARAAEFYEEEVDEMVKGLSTLMEPIIIVVLGDADRRHRRVDVPAHLQDRPSRLTDGSAGHCDTAVAARPGVAGAVHR
jgi:type IV pilus assembly protein PilC